MSKNNPVVLRTSITSYSFDSIRDALRRISVWNNEELLSDRESAKFIIQLFNQIPEELYNDIINET